MANGSVVGCAAILGDFAHVFAWRRWRTKGWGREAKGSLETLEMSNCLRIKKRAMDVTLNSRLQWSRR